MSVSSSSASSRRTRPVRRSCSRSLGELPATSKLTETRANSLSMTGPTPGTSTGRLSPNSMLITASDQKAHGGNRSVVVDQHDLLVGQQQGAVLSAQPVGGAATPEVVAAGPSLEHQEIGGHFQVDASFRVGLAAEEFDVGQQPPHVGWGCLGVALTGAQLLEPGGDAVAVVEDDRH